MACATLGASWFESRQVLRLVSQHSPQGSGRLFPHFVCRVAGLPVRCLESLRADASRAAYLETRDVQARLDEAREPLTEALYQAIGGLDDKKMRRALLNIRRDVHNRRLPRASHLEAAADALSPELRDRLQHFRQLGLQQRQAEAELLATCEREVIEIRGRFQHAVEDEDFRRGLLLSSRTLAGELPRYIRAPAEKPGSKARQIERSLMRYFSRMVMKSTPFGTFCAIVPGRLSSSDPSVEAPDGGTPGAEAMIFDGDPRAKSSTLRLNKAIYAQLLGHLLSRPEIRHNLHVELNPTLQLEEGKWVFLAAVDNREVFQRLPPNPVLDLVRQLFDDRPHLPLAALIDELRTNPEVEASRDEAIAFLDRLLEIGFLRFRVGIREQEVNWDRPLRKILESVDDEHAALVCGFLEDLRTQIETYAAADLDRRRQILTTLGERIVGLFDELEAKVKPWSEMPPFYEDTGGAASLELSDAQLDSRLADELADYVRLTSRIAWPRTEQAAMRHFFDTFYGSDHGPVPLLRFYEDYYREHFKAHLERQQRGPGAQQPAEPKEGEVADEEGDESPAESYDVSNPFQLELVEAIQEASKGLGGRLRELWRESPEATEITLERDDLEEVLAPVPEGRTPCRSVSFFVQTLPGFAADGETALVANGYLNGYGKYFSRFLYLLPPEIEADLVASNRELSTQQLAEICGDAGFNANLHPPLLPWEVSYPTGESGAAEEQIKTSDLTAEPDPEDPGRLRLRRGSTGHEVVPVDLGFLNPRMRPPLYQLLSRFTPSASFTMSVPESPEEMPDEPVRYRPRITYRGRLVLARRQWRIYPDAFPKRRIKETEAEYFLRLQRWREELGLPEEVFMRVRVLPIRHQPQEAEADASPAEDQAPEKPAEAPAEPAVEAGQETGEETGEETAPTPRHTVRRRVRQHLHKPQYVDFRNPLLVDLFCRVTENLENYVVTLEERLPAAEHLAHGGEDRYVTELVLQVDFPESREGTDAP